MVAFGAEEAVLPAEEIQHPARDALVRLFESTCPGTSEEMCRLRRDLLSACLHVTAKTMLLVGDIGTGKTTYANLIAFGIYVSRLSNYWAEKEVSDLIDLSEGKGRSEKGHATHKIPSPPPRFDDTGRLNLELSNGFTGGAFKGIIATGMTDTLFMSQLFGIGMKVGTGVDPHPGIFEQVTESCVEKAKGRGTLTKFGQLTEGVVFIDESADALPLVQSALLNVVNGSGYHRVGKEDQPAMAFDGVTIFATYDTEKLKDPNKFRPDLLSRISDVVIRIPSLIEMSGDLDTILDKISDGVRRDLKKHYDRIVKLRNTADAISDQNSNNIQLRDAAVTAEKYWRSAGKQSDLIEEKDHEFLAECDVSRLGEYRGLRRLVQTMYLERISLEDAVEKSLNMANSPGSGEPLFQRLLASEQPGRTLTKAVKEEERADREQLKEQIRAHPQPVAEKFGVSESDIKKQARDLVRPIASKSHGQPEHPDPDLDEEIETEMAASR